MDLFTQYPHTAGHRGVDTSVEAAQAINGRVPFIRSQVLHHLGKVAEYGATADEAAYAIGEDILSVRPRFTELQRLGKIVATLKRRKNRSGVTARVYVLPIYQGDCGNA